MADCIRVDFKNLQFHLEDVCCRSRYIAFLTGKNSSSPGLLCEIVRYFLKMPVTSRTIIFATIATFLSTALLILEYYRNTNGHFDFEDGTRQSEASILGEYINNDQQPMWGLSKPWAHRTCHSHPDDIPDTGMALSSVERSHD